MGTNYYCEDECWGELHIGKQSVGWEFCVRIYPHQTDLPCNWTEWRRFLVGKTIVDEYGSVIARDDLIRMVEKPSLEDRPGEQTVQWYIRNKAEPSRRGLARAVEPDGDSRPWNYCEEEFC